MLNSATARFTDSVILKAVIDPSDPNIVEITILDEYGDEVTETINLTYPKFFGEVVNNSSSDATFNIPHFTEFGVKFDQITVISGNTLSISSVTGTQDGTNYGLPLQMDPADLTVAYSNLVNCTLYGGVLIIIDPTKDSGGTVTLTD